MNDTNKKIYFIGIGGIGMSAAAGIASELGFDVIGSDSKALYDPAKSVLEEHDIPFYIGYDAAHVIDSEADIYVASAGEDLNNPEVAYLREHDMEILSLSELLRMLADDKLRIVVAGTHGKSTTTGLLGVTLQEADDSSFMTGAVLQGTNTNFHVGDGHYFVFEGDEYKALFDDPTPKFQQYQPDILVLTNLEFDHPDVFSTFEELQDEFRQLLASLPADAFIAYNADNITLTQLVHEVNIGSASYGIANLADFTAQDITYGTEGTTFAVVWKGQKESYRTSLYGEMNVYNALAVIATLRTLGFRQEIIQSGFDEYRGVKRRFELIGSNRGVTVYDDYAHHPTAIKETLLTARSRYPEARIWAVFEPHTYSRTESTLPDLERSFTAADKVLIAEIYPARESKTSASITGQIVVDAIRKHHTDVQLVSGKQEALQVLSEQCAPGDVVVIMAVGSFNELARDLNQSLI